jgi:hypothetical protein
LTAYCRRAGTRVGFFRCTKRGEISAGRDNSEEEHAKTKQHSLVDQALKAFCSVNLERDFA